MLVSSNRLLLPVKHREGVDKVVLSTFRILYGVIDHIEEFFKLESRLSIREQRLNQLITIRVRSTLVALRVSLVPIFVILIAFLLALSESSMLIE